MTAQLSTSDRQTEAATQRTCSLASCRPRSRATIVALGCATNDACRLRALGLCEGTDVSVIDARHAMLLDVRGTRLALCAALTSGITVRLLTAHG